MAAFKDIDSWSLIFVISLISSFATEVTSNTAISTLILPILAELVSSDHYNMTWHVEKKQISFYGVVTSLVSGRVKEIVIIFVIS